MNKRWPVFAIGGLFLMSAANSPAIDYVIARVILIIGTVLFFYSLMLFFRRKREKAEEKEQARQAAEAERTARQEQIQQEYEAEKARQAAEAARFTRTYYPVAGVTFKNEDGSSRQRILRSLCDGEEYGHASVTFDEYEYEGSPAIRVLTDSGCVGNIRQSQVEEFQKYFDTEVHSIFLSIDTFEDDEGKRIYRADVVVVEEKNVQDEA